MTPDLSQRTCDFCQMNRPVSGAAVESVVIKLPMFDPLNPELWFVQCEAQFELKNVTVDQSKHYHVVASLDLVIQQRLKATLMSPPVAEKFNLKQVLLVMNGLLDEQKAEKILDAGSLGVIKLSDMLAFMRCLQGTALLNRCGCALSQWSCASKWHLQVLLTLMKLLSELTSFKNLSGLDKWLLFLPLRRPQLHILLIKLEGNLLSMVPKEEKGKWFSLIYVLTMLNLRIKHTNVHHPAPGMIGLQPLILR